MSIYFCGGTCIEDMTFYIRTNRCSSLYDDIFALRGWKKEELGGIEYELNSILVEKWKGKANTPIAASLQMTKSLVGKGLTEVFRSLFDTYTKKPSG